MFKGQIMHFRSEGIFKAQILHFHVMKAFSKVKSCIFAFLMAFSQVNPAFPRYEGIFKGQIMHFRVLMAFSKVKSCISTL
jgi:hypothetical protein